MRRGPDIEDMGGTNIESQHHYHQSDTLDLNHIQNPTVAKSS